MKNPLSDLYEQILLKEAEHNSLQNPSQDEVGNIKAKADLFGSKPKTVEGPDKAKLDKGPSYKETTGTSSSPKTSNTSMPNAKAGKPASTKEPKEMKDTDVNPKSEEDEDEEENNKKKIKEESFAVSSFEALFKKTLQEDLTPENEMSFGEDSIENEEAELEDSTESDEEEEEEGDLLSDLKDLQDRIASILSKLEDATEEDSEEESEEYSEEDFDAEFDSSEDSEEEAFKESIDKLKPLNNAKGKSLTSKKNKVGKLHPKGGKAYTGKVTDSPSPKALGDKKTSLQKGKPEVKSTVKKGDFIK